MKRFFKHLGKISLELMFLARSGMDEAQAVGMETESAQAVVGGPILLVAHDRMAQILCVNTDLVFAPRFQVEVHQGIVLVADEHLIVGDGEFAPIVGGTGIGHEGLVVFEPRLHGALSRFEAAFQDGHIAAVIDFLFPVLFERHRYFFVFGKEHQARGVAVESVDGMGAATLLRSGEIVIQDALRGFLFLGRAVGEQAFFLVDDHEVFVFIDNLEPFAVETFFGGRLSYFDDHAGLEREIKLRGSFPIDVDDPIGQQMFHFGTADAVHFFHDEGHQWRRLGHFELQRIAF